MNGSRRDFIKATALAAAAAGLPRAAAANAKTTCDGTTRARDILILGGTGFIGPHMVREALRRGHSVTLFNRGRTNDTLFPDLETIRGDRDNGLDGLEGRRWDAVIDNSGYLPRHVKDSARLLAPNCDRYVYVSSISVYEDLFRATDESSSLVTLADETVEEITGETYGGLKALCEKRAAAEIEEGKLTILRPSLICGPGDRTDRFSYWPIRTQTGREMLWPGDRDYTIQIVDVRDLADFTIDCVDRAISGAFNVVNPPQRYSMGALFEDCRAVTASGVKDVWVPVDFLRAQGLRGWADLPAWLGDSGTMNVSSVRALQAGFCNRPERETIRDLLAWWETLPAERTAQLRAGLGAAKEAEVLAAWKAR
jgi:2'-hydroxyisoflavone reductase